MVPQYEKFCLILLLTFFLSLNFTEAQSATFVVDDIGDTDNGAVYTLGDGNNTLRKCVRMVNESEGPHVISFAGLPSLAAGDFHTITLSSPLPTITRQVTIDGYTHVSYTIGNPRVQIRGGLCTDNSCIFSVFLFHPGSDGSIVRGFIMNRTRAYALEIGGVSNMTIEGCILGLLTTGAAATGIDRLLNHGILIGRLETPIGSGIYTNSSNITIGGTTAQNRNIISATDGSGISIEGNSSDIHIVGNYIGASTNGSAARPNFNHGIAINNSSGITIGGTSSGHRNIVSGNTQSGIYIEGSSSVSILGNYIGLNQDGTAAIANGSHGVNGLNSSNIAIGGLTTDTRNVISGNDGSGINMNQVSTSDIFGNYLGLRPDGETIERNAVNGITILNNSSVITIGGTTTSHRNTISGNGDGASGNGTGISVSSNSHTIIIKGNYIGLNAAGDAARGNLRHGLNIVNSNNITIGGTTIAERNVISGNGDLNTENGLSMNGCNGNTITGNYIGINAAGTAKIPNYDSGLSMSNCANNTIGGLLPEERNVISGNGVGATGGRYGIYFSNVDDTQVLGNYIGVGITGGTPLETLGNIQHGIIARNGSDGNTFKDNIIGKNGRLGIEISGSSDNSIYGNYIGIAADGINNVGNLSHGIRIRGIASTNNRVGGFGVDERNFVSGNREHAIVVDQEASGNFIRNNYVGTDISGLTIVSNRNAGIAMFENSQNNRVQNNLVCCSETNSGINVQISSANIIQGNIVGLDANLNRTSGFGNFGNGILIGIQLSTFETVSENNIIGGLGAGEANIIANNNLDGVRLRHGGGTEIRRNSIIGNSIYCNLGLGINFSTTGGVVQEGITPPTITGSLTTLMGTGAVGNTIHIYRNVTAGTGCDCEGEIYIGQTIVAAGGVWSYDISGLGLTQAQVDAMTVTQTNSTNSTSMFSSCTAPLPVTFASFKGRLEPVGTILDWVTSSEKNNKHFEIQKSADGIHYTEIGTVDGQGNSSSINKYEFVDNNPHEGISYYRLKQIDYDGKHAYSGVIKVNNLFDEEELQIWPNPSNGIMNIGFSSVPNSVYHILIYNTTGKEVFNTSLKSPEYTLMDYIDISNLPPSIYNIKIVGDDKVRISKITKY